MNNILEQTVRVEDIALLVGIPLDETTFLYDCNLRRRHPRDGRGDFAWQETQNLLGADAWEGRGKPLTRLVRDLIDTAREAGIPAHRILTAATLDGLSDAAEDGARVIVMLAHWRGANVTHADLDAASWAEIAEALRVADFSILVALDRFLRMQGFDLDHAPDAPADLLDAFVESFNGKCDGDVIARDALDAALVGVFAPGNCVEFRDGVHKPPLVAAALPENWSGIIELSVCHSMALALELRAGRQDRRVIANAEPKYLDRVVPELRETFLRLAKTPCAYVPLRVGIAHAYGSTILEVGS